MFHDLVGEPDLALEEEMGTLTDLQFSLGRMAFESGPKGTIGN